jgi:hypothetical protein
MALAVGDANRETDRYENCEPIRVSHL